MKRCMLALAAALALALAAPHPVLAQAAAVPLELSFWTPFTGGDGQFFDDMVAAFNSSQRDIVMKTDTVRFMSYYPRLSEALAAGTAPDVVVVHQDRLINYVGTGYFLALDPWLARAGIDRGGFAPGPLAACTFKGLLYAMPMDVHPLVMYYNKELFARAGITKVPATTEELFAAARAIQEKTGAIGIAADNTAATYKAYTLTRIFMSLLMEEGRTVLDAGNARANFNNPEGRKAYQFLLDMVYRQGVTPRGLDYDFSVNYFKSGKAGIHFNGVWVMGAFESQPGLDFGVVPFPAFLGPNAAWAGSHAFAIPARKDMDERRVLAIMRFIDWMTAHGALWARAGHIPARSSVYSTPEFRALPHRPEYADAVKYAFPTPATSKWPACYAEMSDFLAEAIALGKDARTAMAQLEARINAILKE